MKSIESFIRDFSKRFKISNENVPITSETLLELDLNIFEIDIDTFLFEFSQYYKVSLSQFDWSVYRYPTGVWTLRFIKKVFGSHSSVFTAAKKKLNYSTFSVRELKLAIENGFLK